MTWASTWNWDKKVPQRMVSRFFSWMCGLLELGSSEMSFREKTWIKCVMLGRDRKKKTWKNPTPHPVAVPLFFWVGFSWVAGGVRKLTQILGWMMDPRHSGCTCLYISVTSTNLQRHAALSAAWRWLKMHSQNINLLLPFGLRGAQWAEEILACLWPICLFWDA